MKAPLDEKARQIVAERAAQWLCDLREAGPREQEQFLTWLKQSPGHVSEFLLTATVWKETREIAASDTADLDTLIKAAVASERQYNIVSLQNKPAAAGATRSRRTWRFAAAAAVAVFALTGIFGWWAAANLGGDVFVTSVGEQRTVRLDDGSLLHMNTHSKVQVRFSKQARDLRLLEGEVLFTAQRDPVRPFRVIAGSTVIQAIGTQFNVYRRTAETRVSVIEGAVEIRDRGQTQAPRVSAGEEARVAASGTVSKRIDPTIADALAWRERRLVFRGERLEDVAVEFNRYNQRHIRVTDTISRNRLLSGTFDADDPDSLILFLKKLDDVNVESTATEFVVSAR